MKTIILVMMITVFTGIGLEQAKTKKEIVRNAFDAWAANGTSDVFDLLSDELHWRINGSTPWSKTYTSKQQFMEEVIIPLNKKLSAKIKPTVRSIYQDGNTVIVIWDGQATALDGRPYRSTYSWNMTFDGDKIVRVEAFLDTQEFGDIMRRIRVE
ncbi:nuclear transport factor 2 family protein [Flavihumibacter petaseus]|uniref:SnoaL-like domain-containing protein n=1 Tax=Flavihumibacter petaseus NBRC 106054 TaxID=1220578 RepID=A0A0E9N2L7_9BACT|nr:nuclear transport factor 2 family protein [Flavihumibacter petaseus]GAO44089.1 hypothetical protein FPE01S_03_01290 [Flavihumibacter petaseus NBRC 106054]